MEVELEVANTRGAKKAKVMSEVTIQMVRREIVGLVVTWEEEEQDATLLLLFEVQQQHKHEVQQLELLFEESLLDILRRLRKDFYF